MRVINWHDRKRNNSFTASIFSGMLLSYDGHAIEVLRYRTEGRGFDSRWCHWNGYGPGVDSASNRNE